MSLATADLCDAHVTSPTRLSVVESGTLQQYGGRSSFYGPVETIRCFESNPLVRTTLEEAGKGRVLVVDGGGSRRVALLGDELAKLAERNGWAGVVVNGCIRDSAVIRTLAQLGVLARGTHPLKSRKDPDAGERGVTVAFGGVEWRPHHWIYADEDGVVVSETPLHKEALE